MIYKQQDTKFDIVIGVSIIIGWIAVIAQLIWC
jgi:hypothetical protein